MNDGAFLEDKLVLSKANDTIYLSEKRFSPCFYGFLNEHQAQLIKNSISFDETCSFWGGYTEAQRVIFGANVHDISEFPIVALKFKYKKEFKLTHSDFLGALMSLSIERSTVGDILVLDGETIVFVKTEMAGFIRDEVTKIGRVGVKITEVDLCDINYVNEFELFDLTVSSLRLDVFVAALCSLSRDKSQKMIKADLVCVNHIVTENVSAVLKVGDVITVRKFGKFVFTDEKGLSKKRKTQSYSKTF